jgi:hypothetical protein
MARRTTRRTSTYPARRDVLRFARTGRRVRLCSLPSALLGEGGFSGNQANLVGHLPTKSPRRRRRRREQLGLTHVPRAAAERRAARSGLGAPDPSIGYLRPPAPGSGI